MSRTTTILLVVVIGALLLIGGDYMLTRKEIRDRLWVAFDAAGYPGEWGVALGLQESDLNPRAVNMSGTDGARGGAWGVTQVTEKTARLYGYTGPMQRFVDDPVFAISFTLRLINEARPQTLEDLGAWWNAGRRTFAALPETQKITHKDGTIEIVPHRTRYVYVPSLLTHYQEIVS